MLSRGCRGTWLTEVRWAGGVMPKHSVSCPEHARKRNVVLSAGLESNGADRHRVEAERSARQNGAAAAAPPREAEGGRATRDRQHPPPRAEREGARPGAWRDVNARGDPSRGDPGRGARAGAWRDTGRGDPGRGDPGRDSRADVRDRGGPGPGSGRGHDRDGGARSDRAHARSPGRGEHHDRSARIWPPHMLLVPAGGSAFALETCHSSSTREALAVCSNWVVFSYSPCWGRPADTS